MDDRIRISDADRDGAAARLRDHFAEGRLSQEELDERITATLSAKTQGDLRRVMADLPDDVPVPPRAVSHGLAGPRPVYVFRRGPRIVPLAIIALIAALVVPGAGWLFFAFLKVMLLIWLITVAAGLFAAARLRRHLRGYPHPGWNGRWHSYQERS